MQLRLSQISLRLGGGHGHRGAALVFGLWPSRGLDIEGIEIKVSRSDWRKEIEDPAKAATFSRYCHRWWIAAAPDIVETGELPSNWGLLELKRGVLRQKVEAPREDKPEVISHKMWCAVMRSVQRTEIDALRRREGDLRRQVREEVEKQHDDRLGSLTEAVEAFKEATGVDVRYAQYRLDEFKQALKLIEEGRQHDHVLRSVRNLPDQLRQVADRIDEAV